MACKLVIKDKHIQSVLGKSEFESLDDFQGVFYNKFVLNPSAIPVTSSKGITFLRLSQNEDQSISVTLRTNTELPIENYNLELPEDTVKINDYEAVIPPTINENGNPVADLDTFMYLWLGNYYFPDIDKLNKLFEKTIPEVLKSFATKLVYEQKDRLEKGEVIPNESRNFVESLIGEKGLINYYASIIEAHYKSSPAQLEKLEEIKGEIAEFTKIIDQFSPIEEKPLEKKYANYTMISLGEDLSPEEAEIAKDLKETEEQPTAEKNTTVVKSFSKPTATFDSDTTDNAEVGKSILMNLVNNDPREFRAVMAIDDPSFVQNKIVVNNQVTSLKVNQVNTKNPSVIIIEVKEGNEWKKVFLKKNTSGLVKTSDLAKLDSFSLTTDPAEAYQFNYELEENNEVKSLKSPQLTLRSEQLSTLSKDPQKKAAIENLYNELKSKGLSIFHYILKGSKAITRNYLPLKVRGFSIEDITIKATGPYKGIPQINGEYIDTGVLPENVKQEVKDLLNFNYSSEREVLEVVKYLNALIGVGDFTPIESADAVGTNRINITRRTIGFFPDVVNGKYVIKSVVYRYKDEGKFYYNSTKEKLDFLSYDGNSKTLIDKSLDAARLQLPKVPFKKGMQEPHEIVGEYPTKYVVREGALEIVEWSAEEQHNFILENSKTHLTKSGDTIANFDQILYVSGFTREAEQAPQVPTQPASTDLSEKNTELNKIKTENALVGQSILKKAGYKNENRLPNGNVKGGQAGWKIRFNIKNPKTGNSYYADGKSTLVDEEYNKRAETLVNFLLEYFGSNQKADSKKLEKHYIIEDKDGTKREPFKHLTGGEIGESDFTIYIGSADDVLKFISDIRTKHPEIIDLLHQGNQSGDVMIDNIFKGRIEGAKIGFSEYHVPSNLYKLVGSNEFSFVHKGDRIVVNYGNGNLSDIFVYNERTRKGYGGVFDKNMQKDQPELYKNIRNIIGFQLYGKYLTGSNNEFVKFTGVSQEDLLSLSNVTPTPQVSDKEGTAVDIKEISKKFTDIQKLFKSLFDKKAKDTIIVFKTLPNNRAYTEIKSDSSEYTQDELNERGIKVTLKKNQKINKIIYIDANSFDAALTEDENQSSLTSQAIVEEMIHALTYDKIATKEVLESEEYERIVNAIKQLQDSVNLDSLTDEQKKYFDYYIGVKGEEITPAQVLEFLASTQIEVLKPIFESANIDYPKADYSSLYEYLESLFKSLKKFLSDLLLKDSPSLQERITSDTISIILDKVTKAQTLQTQPLESIPTGEQPSSFIDSKKAEIEKRTKDLNDKFRELVKEVTELYRNEGFDKEQLLIKLLKKYKVITPQNTRINNWSIEELINGKWVAFDVKSRGGAESFFGKENWENIVKAKEEYDIEFKKIKESYLVKNDIIEQRQRDLLSTTDGLELRKSWSLGLIEEDYIVGLDSSNFVEKETELSRDGLVEKDNYIGYYFLPNTKVGEEWDEEIRGNTEQEVIDKINAKYEEELAAFQTTKEIDEVEKIIAEVGTQPEIPPVSVDGETSATERGVEPAPISKGKVTAGLSRKFNKKSDTELYTLIESVKPKFSTSEKTELAFEDLAVKKSAANHLDMVAAEYLFFENSYTPFIFNQISLQDLIELGKDILQRELDDPETTKERKNFVQYFYNNIETIWIENSKLLSIIDRELREEYSPEAESDTTIDGELKIGQDASESESNGGDSSSKFEERTEQKKSVLETIGVYAEHFVRMIPRIKTIDGVPQYESFEEDGITFTSPEYLRDNYGNLVPADYTTTWNSIADIVKGSMTIEEMILVLESSFLKVPEVAIFLDRLKRIGATREDTLLLKNLEKSLQKVFIPTEVMVQQEAAEPGGVRNFSIFAQGRLDLINIQNILSSRFREKFANFIVGLEVDYVKFNAFLKENTGVQGTERFVSPDNYKQIVNFWANNGINIPAKLPENLRIKLEKNLAVFTFELIAKFNELEKYKISNAVADIKGFDLFSFVAKDTLLNGNKIRSNSLAKNAVLTSLADVLPYSTSNMTKNAEGENQSNLHNFSSFLIYIKYINNLYKNGTAFRDKIYGAIPRLKNHIAKYSWVLDKVRAGATITPINLSGVQYTNKGTNTINLDLIPYLQFQMQSLLLNNTKENLRAETASTSFGFRIDNSKEKLPISKSVLQSMRPIFESYLRGEIERITKEKKSDYKYYSKYNNKKDKFTFLDGVLSDNLKGKIYEIINNNLDKSDEEIWGLVLPLRQEYVNDFTSYKAKIRENFENFIFEETGVVLSIEHPIFNNGSLKEHVNSIGFNDAIDMFLMNGVVLGIEEIILFHGEVGQFDKFYKRSKSTISNGTSVVVGQNLKKLLQTTLQGYTFSEIIGGQRPEYYSDPTQLKTSTFSDDLMPLSDKQRENLEKGTVNSLELSAKSFGKKFNKKEAEKTAKKTTEQYDNANIGDGQGWIHPDAYRMVLMGVDSWSPEREEGFIYLAIKEKKRRGFPLEEKDVQKLKEVEDKIKTKGYYFQFPDIKFQYRGGSVLTATIDGKEVDVEAPTAIEVLDKFALAPLFPEFAQNSIAEKMLEHMTKNNIAYTKFESATKIGGFEKNNLNDLLSDDFEFKGVHKITTVFLKEQVKTPSKIKEQDSLGTQKRKLLISNLSIDGKFLDEMKPFYNMWKGNQRSLADKARKDLYEDLGIDPKVLENPNAKIDININKLVALLRKEIDKRDLPKPLRAFFEKDFGPKEMVFFEQSLSPKIVENMLYSMLKNRIVKAKFPGSQLIQISSSLFNRTTNVNENGRDLEFYRYDELTGKILPAQCKMTLHGPFLNLLNLPEVKANGGNLEALNALLRDPEFRNKHKNVITVVSYRIPTQGYNSMDILEIVEFLPGYLGNTIIPPPQITVKSGTDFDYDKMPTIYPNIDKDGNYISSDNVDKSISQLSKEQYKERLVEVREKIKEAKEAFKEKNKNAIETALTDINVPGEIVEENLDSKKLERLKTLKEHLMNEINSMKQDAEEIKEILNELKPILNKNVSYKERARQYKEKYGEDLDIKKQVEIRGKLYDGLAVLKDSITKNYELLNKLKNIKGEASDILQPLFEERDLLLRSRKVEAVYVNGLIEAAKGILLHPMNFHRLITPNNVSIVTDKIQEILERIYGTKNVNPEPVNTDIFDYTTHLKKWLAVKIKDLLGITAVNNTFFALMQEANFSFNNTIDINDSSFDFKTPLLTNEERKEARVTNPFLADSGIEKLEILNQFINLFVDAASNDIAGYTNLIRDNVGFVILQNDLGVPFDRTLALIHQPIIYRYNQIVKENTGKGLSKAQAEKIAISELLNVRTSVDGFPLKSSKVWAQIKKEYDEKIDLLDIDDLSNNVVTKDNISNFENNPTQQAALLYYIVGIKQADALREAQSNVNYDTSPIQSYKRSVVRENIIKRIEKTGFVSKWAMERIKSGVIGHLNIHNELKFLSEKLFPIKADPDFVDFSAPLFEKIPTNKLDEFITTFDNDFLMYIIQNFSINFNQERYEYIKSLMSNGSLMIRWNQLIAKYKLEETRLAQKLYPVTQGYSSANPAIFMGLDNDSEEFNAIEEEIRSYANPVGNSPREIELKAFANDLMDLGFFQTGYNTGRLYMLKVLPAEYTDQFKDAFVNFYNLTKEEKRREYAKFLGAFESQRFDGIAAPLIAPEDQMMMATYFGTTSDVLINYLEDTSIAQQKGYNSSTTPKRGLTALTEVIAPIENISRLGTSTTFTIFDNTVKKEVTKTGITLSIQGHPNVKIYATKEVSTEKSEVGSTKFNTVTDKVYLNIVHATLGSVVVSDVNAKDLQELLNSFKTKVNKSLSKTAIGISTLKDLGFTITDTSKPVAQSSESTAIDFQEDQNTGYAARTKINASADATIAIAYDFNSAGEKLTKSSVLYQNKLYLPVSTDVFSSENDVNAAAGIIARELNNLSKNEISLNIAGNGIYTLKGTMTQSAADSFTLELLQKVIERLNPEKKIISIRTGGQTGFDEAGAKAGIKLGIPTTVLAPKGWKFRNATGQDISNEQAFKARFNITQTPVSASETQPTLKTLGTLIPSTPVKQGVEELFEENKELANAVYEAAGFVNTSEIQLDKPRFNPDNVEATSYPIKINGEYAGVVSVDKDGYISSSIGMAGVELEKEFQGKGYGTKVYIALAEQLAKEGKTLKSEFFGKDNINESANRVWESLLNKGYAIDKGSYFEIQLKDKQQAQQLYSYYLDSVFPDSKVKDIVYHTTDKTFDKFNKPSEQSLAKGADDGIYFSKDPNYYTDLGNKIASILNLKTPMKYSHEIFMNAIDASGYRQVEGSDGFITYIKEDEADLDAIKPQFPYIDPNDFSEEELKEIENNYQKELDKWKQLAAKEELVFATVFEPEQIHILGSKSDIEGFKEYVSKQTQPEEETLCQTPSLVSKNSIDIPFA